MKCLIVACVLVAVTSAHNLKYYPLHEALSDELINYINNEANITWKAGRSFEGWTVSSVKRLCGVLPDPSGRKLPLRRHKINKRSAATLPDTFDARVKWPDCPTIREIRDQGACGSSWAFGAVEVISDRICLKSGGKSHAHISAQDLLSCCHSCGYGCDGGFPESAWRYFKHSGVVTGGQYNSKQGCQPYLIKACGHHVVGKLAPCSGTVPTPRCEQQCVSGYPKKYFDDKHYGVSVYSVRSDVLQIQAEILNNGPVQATFSMYADFPSYKSGVYQHKSGGLLGGHSVKILGWGVENETPYWLAANSWNTDWGAHGFFKILRGRDECGIESGVIAGEPKV